MIKIEHVTIPCPKEMEFIIEGMRNPKNSWNRSDSYMVDTCVMALGENDDALAKTLAKGGDPHSKYLRMMPVYMRISAPLYWWKEMDTYKVGTVSNSCSTMHKMCDRPLMLGDFSIDHLNEVSLKHMQSTIDLINDWMKLYIEGNKKDKELWWQMIQLLPSSYIQTRNWSANYAVLANIYCWRKNHKQDEWREFCKVVEELPYFEWIKIAAETKLNGGFE